MSACMRCLRYICCRVEYTDSDSENGVYEHVNEVDTLKKSVYKKVSTWSAYIGRDQLDARDKKIHELDEYLKIKEPSDEFSP